jgi:hypothetical protein
MMWYEWQHLAFLKHFETGFLGEAQDARWAIHVWILGWTPRSASEEWLEARPQFRTSWIPKELGIWPLRKVMGCWITESYWVCLGPSKYISELVREHKEATNDAILPLHGEKSMHRSWRMPKIPQAMQPQGNFINPNSPQLSPRDMESIEWFRLLLIILGYWTGGVKDWQRVQSLCYPLGSSSMIS